MKKKKKNHKVIAGVMWVRLEKAGRKASIFIEIKPIADHPIYD